MREKQDNGNKGYTVCEENKRKKGEGDMKRERRERRDRIRERNERGTGRKSQK